MAVYFLPKSRMKKCLERTDLPADTLTIDVSGKAPEPWNALSTAFCHGEIPVPGMPGVVSQTVDGIWEGLKRFENEGETLALLEAEKPKKRRVTKATGKLVGHLYGAELLRDEVDARRRLLIPAYVWMVRNCPQARARFAELVELASSHTLHIYDGEEGANVNDAKSFSCAALLTELVKEARKARAAALV